MKQHRQYTCIAPVSYTHLDVYKRQQLALATTSVYAWKPAHREKAHTECEVPAKTNAELASIAGVHANTITQAKAVQTKACLLYTSRCV